MIIMLNTSQARDKIAAELQLALHLPSPAMMKNKERV